MLPAAIVADSYFDGETFHENGPFAITIENGRIESIAPCDGNAYVFRSRQRHFQGEAAVERAPFLMPGLAEGHAHLFLDGAELDFKTRSDYLKGSRDDMAETARRNVRESAARGITLIRDAGDIHGVNGRIKAEMTDCAGAPAILSAGAGLRRARRYGSFFAVEVDSSQDIERRIDELAANADQIKIVLTGIIDFKKGVVSGSPQFNVDETKRIVNRARSLGLRTFAHCSGIDGLRVAVEAGIDSIEHGFFMDDETLERMADRQIVWTPTFSPVAFQFDHPDLCGWDSDAVGRLGRILDNHYERLGRAYRLGVPVIMGSDAGSYGVRHGTSLVDEIVHATKAGVPLEAALASATSVPRKIWGRDDACIRPGNAVDMVALDGTPRESLDNLRAVRKTYPRDAQVCGAGGIVAASTARGAVATGALNARGSR